MNNNTYIQLREYLFSHRREVEIELFEALWENIQSFFNAELAKNASITDSQARAQGMLDRFVSIVFHRSEEGTLRLPSFIEVMELADAFKLCFYNVRDLDQLADHEENIMIVPDDAEIAH